MYLFFFSPCQLDPLQTLVPSYVRHHNNQVKSDELDIMLQQSTLIFSNVACTRQPCSRISLDLHHVS